MNLHLNRNHLKIAALIAMTFDHIAIFFPERFPIYFHWIGRLAAPIFMFLCAESITYTTNKFMYVIRLYLASVIMGLIQSFTQIEMNIFRSIFMTAVSCCIIAIHKTDKRTAAKYASLFLIWQVATSVVVLYINQHSSAAMEDFAAFLLPAISGNCLNLDGGIFYVILGIAFYIFRDDKRNLAFSFCGLTAIHTFCNTTHYLFALLYRVKLVPVIGSELSDALEFFFELGMGPLIGIGESALYVNYSWMMTFSLPIILNYKSRKIRYGRFVKYFFYFYYPSHILLLHFLAV